MYEMLSHNSHDVTLNTIIIAIPVSSSTYIAYIILQYKQLVSCTHSTQCSKQHVCSTSTDENALARSILLGSKNVRKEGAIIFKFNLLI